MGSSALKLLIWVVVACLSVYAQNPAKKIQPGSISGKVTMKGNAVPGIMVGARLLQSGRPTAPIVVTTDQQGNYRMSNVPPGEYEVVPAAQQYVLATHNAIRRFFVVEGDNFEGVDFTLIRGGVITGKVTDEEGHPLIDEYVDVTGPEGSNAELMTSLTLMNQPTDDRGVYRVFGLRPGKYRVSAGVSSERMRFLGTRRTVYIQTFHPSTTESAKATLIEVTEGSEATNVDIVLRRTQPVYTVTARVVDGETGKPIPDARYGLAKYTENGSTSTSGFATNKLGELRIENVMPGKYAIYLESARSGGGYAEPLHFEVVDQDVKDLLLKTSSGISVSGVVVFEGLEEKVRPKFNDLMLFVFVQNPEFRGVAGGGHAPSTVVNADGSFTLSGMQPGLVFQFGIWPQTGSPRSQLEIVRVERDGVVQSNIELKPGEDVRGLRLIVRLSSGSIRGLVKFENGTLASARVQIYIKRVGDEKFGRPAELDDRGRFMLQGLSAGVYEVTVVAYPSRYRGTPLSTKQQVVVNDNQVSEVTLTLDLKADTGQGGL